ncbi:MAG: hypothetical protein ACLUKN_02860 [Bacilli bacterium]
MTKENLPENLLRLMRAKNYVPQTLPELALQLGWNARIFRN